MEPSSESLRLEDFNGTAPGQQLHQKVICDPETKPDGNPGFRLLQNLLRRVQWKRFDESPIQCIVFQYNILHWIFRIVPDTETVPEKFKNK